MAPQLAFTLTNGKKSKAARVTNQIISFPNKPGRTRQSHWPSLFYSERSISPHMSDDQLKMQMKLSVCACARSDERSAAVSGPPHPPGLRRGDL